MALPTLRPGNPGSTTAEGENALSACYSPLWISYSIYPTVLDYIECLEHYQSMKLSLGINKNKVLHRKTVTGPGRKDEQRGTMPSLLAIIAKYGIPVRK